MALGKGIQSLHGSIDIGTLGVIIISHIVDSPDFFKPVFNPFKGF